MIAISACLIGEKCRYDGKDNLIPEIRELMNHTETIIICPEVMGGLSTPREPCERCGSKIFSRTGLNQTTAFENGAKETLKLLKKHSIEAVILKERSPSCGTNQIYDGKFSGELIFGQGVTAELLTKNGYKLYSEQNLEQFFNDFPKYKSVK